MPAKKPTGNQESLSDYRLAKQGARQNEAAQREYYENQMRSEGLNPQTNAIADPVSYKPSFVPAPVHSAIKSGPGGSVAGLILGGILFFTGRAYVTGGWSGVRAWYAAKFLNKTSSQPNNIPSSTVTTTPSTSSSSSTPPAGSSPGSGRFGVPSAGATINPQTGTTSAPNPVIQVVTA